MTADNKLALPLNDVQNFYNRSLRMTAEIPNFKLPFPVAGKEEKALFLHGAAGNAPERLGVGVELTRVKPGAPGAGRLCYTVALEVYENNAILLLEKEVDNALEQNIPLAAAINVSRRDENGKFELTPQRIARLQSAAAKL